MLRRLLTAALLLAGVQPAPDENLAVGRPSLVSSSAAPLSSCTTGSHLEVDAGVAGVSDDCGCVITGGSAPPNLREWLASGFRRSDLYIIDPDGADGSVEPFTVFCNMSDSNDVFKASTVVRHMVPARTLVSGNAAALSIQFPISYEANATQMKALMSVSAHCRQWLQYECNGSAIYSGTTQMAGWYSRMNDLQPGWSGMPSGTAGCACFRRGQCAGGVTAKCNCDKRDSVWRTDAGWIEDMDLLPVSKLAFGDATTQNGYFTLGDLVCYG